MAGLFDMQADVYADARPSYPADWFAKLASLTPHHALAWDAGTGSGQAAIGVSFSCPQHVPPSSSYETEMEYGVVIGRDLRCRSPSTTSASSPPT